MAQLPPEQIFIPEGKEHVTRENTNRVMNMTQFLDSPQPMYGLPDQVEASLDAPGHSVIDGRLVPLEPGRSSAVAKPRKTYTPPAQMQACPKGPTTGCRGTLTYLNRRTTRCTDCGTQFLDSTAT